MTDTQKSLILICFFSFHFSLPKGGLALGRQEVHAVAEQRKHEIARFLKSLFSSQLGIIHILRLHIFGTFLAHPTHYVSQHEYSTENQKKLPFFNPPTQSYLDVIYEWSQLARESDLVYTFFHPLLRDQQDADIHLPKLRGM